jgi:hypothetical protein
MSKLGQKTDMVIGIVFVIEEGDAHPRQDFTPLLINGNMRILPIIND